MTDLLYFEDSYMKTFVARVIEAGEDAVVLDRTAFYPGGGGQPADSGMLRVSDQTWQVSRAKKSGGELWHKLGQAPPAVGTEVAGELDWDRRYQLMRTHTAMHILCGVIWRDYQVSVTGGNMEPLHGRMDFEFGSMSKELAAEIEGRINVEVDAARPVTTDILPREQAFQIPDLIRTKINLLPEGIQEVRVVEIEGLDLQADGGTHVANTREVGPIHIVDYKSKGAENKRLVVELEPVE
jgi:misacylated tRNA(Ala) deacylase